MNGWLVLALLILSSSLPALAVFLWFRIARYQFSSIRFLLVLLTGAAAFFPALILQSFFPSDFYVAGRIGLLVQIFLPIALTEETSRLIVLLVFFAVARRIDGKNDVSALAVTYGTVVGLIAGFGFAILESAAYGAANADVILLRLFTAAPIHGACGARVGSAAVLFRSHPGQGLLRFLTAVVIHGIYNSMIVIPGFASIAAVLIALFSLASVVLSIRGGMKRKADEPIPGLVK